MGRSRRFPKAVFSASTLGSNRGEPRNRPRVSQGITVLIWNAVCVAILSRSPIPIVVQYSGDKEPDLPTWQKHEGEISKRNGRRSDKGGSISNPAKDLFDVLLLRHRSLGHQSGSAKIDAEPFAPH